jgi:hypothetical protein
MDREVCEMKRPWRNLIGDAEENLKSLRQDNLSLDHISEPGTFHIRSSSYNQSNVEFNGQNDMCI